MVKLVFYFLRLMPINKIIIGFFLLLFSFQLVPDQQVGFRLYSNQITEEISDCQETENIKYAGEVSKQFEFSHLVSFHKELQPFFIISGKAFEVKLITRSSDDIQTPPPNNTI